MTAIAAPDYILENGCDNATMLPEYWGWWFDPLDGSGMNKVNLAIFYYFGSGMRDLRGLRTGMKQSDFTIQSFHPSKWLTSFVEVAADTSALTRSEPLLLMRSDQHKEQI